MERQARIIGCLVSLLCLHGDSRRWSRNGRRITGKLFTHRERTPHFYRPDPQPNKRGLHGINWEGRRNSQTRITEGRLGSELIPCSCLGHSPPFFRKRHHYIVRVLRTHHHGSKQGGYVTNMTLPLIFRMIPESPSQLVRVSRRMAIKSLEVANLELIFRRQGKVNELM